MPRNSRGHTHIGSMGSVGDLREPTQAEAIAGRLLENRNEAVREKRAKKNAEKAELLRPRRYPREGGEGKA